MHRELDLFAASARSRHSDCAGDELVEVDRIRCVADLWRRPLREVPKDGDRVVGGVSRCLEALSVGAFELPSVDLFEIRQGRGHVVAKVVNHTLDSATVEEVAIGVGQLRLEHAADAPAGDGVRERQGQNANDRREEVAEQGAIQYVADQKASKCEVAEGYEEGTSDVVSKDCGRRFSP